MGVAARQIEIPTTKVVHSEHTEPKDAVAELKRELAGATAVFFFCSHRYDLEALGAELATFSCPLTGCTSAGQIGPGGFVAGGITALGLFGDNLRVTTHAISPLTQHRAAEVATSVNAIRASSGYERAFGLLLFDGLAMAEEPVTSSLYQTLVDVPIVGGSAGDDLAFERTHVFIDGVFRERAACLTLVETDVPFTTFKLHHFEPTEERVVVTASAPAIRRVYELNGEIPSAAYARAIGMTPEALGPEVFSRHPFVIRVGEHVLVRSIRRVESDGSLTLFCAVEDGQVLRIGRPLDRLQSIRSAFEAVREALGDDPSVILGCDCILRRLEFVHAGADAAVGRLYAENNVFGFSTYGEQFNSSHVNQTFTGVALGR